MRNRSDIQFLYISVDLLALNDTNTPVYKIIH